MKKNKILQSILLVSLPFILGACSSKDDGGPASGSAMSPDGKIIEITSKNMEEITIDGQKIILTIPEIEAGDLLNTWKANLHINGEKLPPMIVSGTNYSFTKFGMVLVNNKKYAFSHGHKTPDMPTTGIFSYRGDAIHSNGSDPDSKPLSGKSSFRVDFASKKLNGLLAFKDKDSIAINANISGNSFSGDAHGTQTTGNFYGPNAAELSGQYKNGDITGAYGAKKQ